MTRTQAELDSQNADFWDELCGTALAEQIGITEVTAENLRRFDRAYLDEYPYLVGYLPFPDGDRRDLLEIGLGYGTVGQILVERGFRYQGADLAEGPCAMMRYRLDQLDVEGEVTQASVLDLPFEHESFDHVVSIGCIHHTGDISRGIAEVKRVLRPGGTAMVMLYNRHSWRQIRIGAKLRLERLRGGDPDEHDARATFERNTDSEIAPMVDFVSRREVRRMFSDFSKVRIDARNFDPLIRNYEVAVPRERLLGTVDRVLGLDLYVTATK